MRQFEEESRVTRVGILLLKMIANLSINCSIIETQWNSMFLNKKIGEQLASEQIKKRFSCGSELRKVLKRFGNKEKLDSEGLVRITYGYLNSMYSENHAKLFELGFFLVRHFQAVEIGMSLAKNKGKSFFTEQVEQLQKHLAEILAPDTIDKIIDLLIEEMKIKKKEFDIKNFLIQVFKIVM